MMSPINVISLIAILVFIGWRLWKIRKNRLAEEDAEREYEDWHPSEL